MLPTKLLYDHAVTEEAKITWAVLDDIGRGEPFKASMSQVAAAVGVSVPTAERRVRTLRDTGWLTVSGNRGRARENIYFVVGSRRRAIGSDGASSLSSDGAMAPSNLMEAIEVSSSPLDSEKGRTSSSRRQPASRGCAGCDLGFITVEVDGYLSARKCPVCFPPPF